MSESSADIEIALGPAPLPHGDAEQLERILNERLAQLPPQQQALVLAFARTGSREAAAKEAGYTPASARNLGNRTWTKPEVISAVEVAIALHEARSPLSRASLVALLERALLVQVQDYLLFSPTGVVIGVKPLDALSRAHHLRLKSLTVKVHKSASGRRAHQLTAMVDLVSATEILDRLVRLRGWANDRPLVDISIGTGSQVAVASAPVERTPRWAQMVPELLFESDDELRRFIASGDEKKLDLIRARLAKELPSG